MKKFDLSPLSIDELWALHEEVGALLSEKITVEKRGLEQRLARLGGAHPLEKAVQRRSEQPGGSDAARRGYPPVLPKYRNPKDPSETWAGRGKQPRWLVSQLKAGKTIDDFLISRSRQPAVAKRKPA